MCMCFMYKCGCLLFYYVSTYKYKTKVVECSKWMNYAVPNVAGSMVKLAGKMQKP